MLNPLYEAVAWLLVHIHVGVGKVIDPNSGAAWALSIILLTIAMRLLLYPVFIRSIRSQRQMQAMQPRMAEIRERYKNDKVRQNEEMQKLWKESGVNPLGGCLPLLLQIPIFISLYHTLRQIKPGATGVQGFPQAAINSAAHAKIFGVPIAAAFDFSAKQVAALGGHQGSTRVLCAILAVVMGATTFLTQKQMMGVNNSRGQTQSAQVAQSQKIMLYVLPAFFLFYGYKFPVGVLIYWCTSNLWTLGQQQIVIRHMLEADEAAAAEKSARTPLAPPPGARPARSAPASTSPQPTPSAVPKPSPAGAAGGAGGTSPAPTRSPNRPAQQRRRRRRR